MSIDHGGNIDEAMRLYGGAPEDWIDLSTGINRTPYPVPDIAPSAWHRLPTKADMARLVTAARRYYGTAGEAVPVNGAQSVIQLLPRLRPKGRVAILGPTYNEYAASFRRAGWQLATVTDPEALAGADIGIIVNPNNPDGRLLDTAALAAAAATVGLLVVDESFMDCTPAASLVGTALEAKVLILKSFGKFFGLAGARLGFVLGAPELCQAVAAELGPWPVSGAAIEVAAAAYADTDWAAHSRLELVAAAARLKALLPWRYLGGTPLFGLFEVSDGARLQVQMARQHLWLRAFPDRAKVVRVGTPSNSDFARLETLDFRDI